MKLNKWFYGAAALAMMASCSDNIDGPNPDNGNGGNQSSSGISYLGVSLELPSEAGTRADDDEKPWLPNDNFDDGLPKEYAVDHAAILLFRGTSESTAKFIGAYKLGVDQAFDQPNGDQITVSFQKTIKVLEKPNLGTNEKLWGLAIVNYSENIFSINLDSENDSEGYGSLTVKTTTGNNELVRYADDATNATTFSEFRGYITDSSFIRTNSGYFFMTNAPMSTAQGTLVAPNGYNIVTLAELKANFEKTETEAVQNPAGCIFVERAVAKITCSTFPASVVIPYTKVTLSASGTPKYETEDYTLNVESVEWIIDNEEGTSFIVRNAQKSDENQPFWDYSYNNKYRFIGNIGMNDHNYGPDPLNQHIKYRTYWCIDPKYSDNKVFNDQANAAEAKFDALTNSNNNYSSVNALYPRENTFDVAHQQYKNTTRVIFKVKYADGAESPSGTFQLYALRGQLQTFYLPTDAQNLLKRSVLGSTSLHDLILKYKLEETLDYTASDFNFTFGYASAANGLVDTDKGIQAGDYVITRITFTDAFIDANFKELDDSSKADIAATLSNVASAANQANHIVQFRDNTCYYAVYLKHFGDSYCPLPAGWVGDTVGEVYVDEGETTFNSERYLGRYGLVRNNWYDLSVNDIKRLGNATVPNGNVETSDDNKTEEWYLSARVHILSWAKRTQGVTFE